MWNERQLDTTPFLRAYEALLMKHGTDYAKVRHENINAQALGAFFAGGDYVTHTFPNEQRFDYEGLAGPPAFVIVCARRRRAGQRAP